MADPRQIVRILSYRGVTVRGEGDRLTAGPRNRLDPEGRRLIARFRSELVAHLGRADSKDHERAPRVWTCQGCGLPRSTDSRPCPNCGALAGRWFDPEVA